MPFGRRCSDLNQKIPVLAFPRPKAIHGGPWGLRNRFRLVDRPLDFYAAIARGAVNATGPVFEGADHLPRRVAEGDVGERLKVP